MLIRVDKVAANIQRHFIYSGNKKKHEIESIILRW